MKELKVSEDENIKISKLISNYFNENNIDVTDLENIIKIGAHLDGFDHITNLNLKILAENLYVQNFEQTKENKN